jgi:hypothetical protein
VSPKTDNLGKNAVILFKDLALLDPNVTILTEFGTLHALLKQKEGPQLVESRLDLFPGFLTLIQLNSGHQLLVIRTFFTLVAENVLPQTRFLAAKSMFVCLDLLFQLGLRTREDWQRERALLLSSCMRMEYEAIKSRSHDDNIQENVDASTSISNWDANGTDEDFDDDDDDDFDDDDDEYEHDADDDEYEENAETEADAEEDEPPNPCSS